MNLANWLTRTAKTHPDSPALFHGEVLQADYAEFARRAAAIGAYLVHTLGIRKGDRVALFMGNSTEYLEVLYGIWFTGAIAVPVNGKLHPSEACWIIEDSGARVVFTNAAYQATMAVAPVEQVIVTDTPDFATQYAIPPLPQPVPIATDDLVWLFYTSGTTGKPKGVMLTSANIMAMTASYFADVDEVHQTDAALYAAPMSHGAGIYNFMHVIRAARHIVPTSGGFDADEILTLAPALQNVHLFAAPTMVRRLVDRAKARKETGKGIRTIVYAGGPMYLADIIEAVDVMGNRFVQVLGQGECPMAISVLAREHVSDRTHPRWRERLAGVGVAQSMVAVQIRNEEGRELPAGEIGEICVSGLPVMAGYWQNPKATEDTIVNGWLKTGDMGAMDTDGFVTLHDRAKDMVISGGSNIYPREVEEVLLQHPQVREVSVVGKPDAEWGEIIVAFVVGEVEDAATLDTLCLNHIARFKRPKQYRFVPSLPKNNYGKVLKSELRNMLAKDG